MVSEYLILMDLSIINTHLSIILPGIFGTYPVFILTKVFMNIPDEVLEAARLDGANSFTLLRKVVLPIGKGGIIAVAVLDFLECINSIEAPLVFLKDRALHPLSLFFPEISLYNVGVWRDWYEKEIKKGGLYTFDCFFVCNGSYDNSIQNYE